MTDEIVLDASVVVNYFFHGVESNAAIAILRPARRRIAPDLIFAEFASVATKLVRRGGVADRLARDAMEQLRPLITEVAPLGDLAGPAYEIARRYSFSAYDGVYLALARARGLRLVTADARLARRAVEVGWADHVHLLSPQP
jgi:predicted nucleic acid-binding protein